jgi:hypothetical protein
MKKDFRSIHRFFFILRYRLRQFHRTISLQRQSDELDALVRWAKRKRITTQERRYRSLWLETEHLLAVQQMRHPVLYEGALLFFDIWSSLFPWWYSIGQRAAAKYSIRRTSVKQGLRLI